MSSIVIKDRYWGGGAQGIFDLYLLLIQRTNPSSNYFRRGGGVSTFWNVVPNFRTFSVSKASLVPWLYNYNIDVKQQQITITLIRPFGHLNSFSEPRLETVWYTKP